jgi:hypothetical protein
MNTYRVDFTPDSLRRNKGARARLMRDVRKVAAKLRKEGATPPRFVRKRRHDRSLGYWFQLDADVQKDKKAAELLKPYGWVPASPPVIPESEWLKL